MGRSNASRPSSSSMLKAAIEAFAKERQGYGWLNVVLAAPRDGGALFALRAGERALNGTTENVASVA